MAAPVGWGDRCISATAVIIKPSLTARTIFDSTKLPLTTWFLAIYLFTQRKNSVSALQLSRELGVSYKTAWTLNAQAGKAMAEVSMLRVFTLNALRLSVTLDTLAQPNSAQSKS